MNIKLRLLILNQHKLRNKYRIYRISVILFCIEVIMQSVDGHIMIWSYLGSDYLKEVKWSGDTKI